MKRLLSRMRLKWEWNKLVMKLDKVFNIICWVVCLLYVGEKVYEVVFSWKEFINY